MKTIAIIFFIILLSADGICQTFPDSKGRDFWFTFIPNIHTDGVEIPSTPTAILEHQLYIYISSETPTKGTITLTDSTGTDSVVNFSITDPTQVYSFQTFFLPYELRGFNYGLNIQLDSGQQLERPMKISAHIEADNDVTVYALNQAWYTSDAFLVLPTDALGTDYAVMSYTSDFSFSGFRVSSSSTPSQFAVVATEDSTVIEIKPTADIFNAQKGDLVSVLLNKGESYLVQVYPRGFSDIDLTGTIISATRPIAVFSGHQRAVVPIQNAPELGSRDCLVEQMTPISTWGRRAFVTQLARSANELDIGSNLFRVLAAFDSTVVYVDGVQVATINAQEFYEGRITGAVEVVTSMPTLVAMFKKTSGSGSGNATRIGDPFMMVVPPAEQFMDRYRFISIQAFDYESFNNNPPVVIGNVYVEQYLNVVIQTDKASTVVIDGVPVNQTLFNRIGASEFSWAQISMADGVHEISADTTFGIYLYGYGEANSYGYTGGMAYQPYDVAPPSITGIEACGLFTGRVTDSILGDSRLRYVVPVSGSAINVDFKLERFSPPQAGVNFTLVLFNPFLDGSIELEASDNLRQITKTFINVPGFTVGLKDRFGAQQPLQQQRVIPANRMRCDSFTVENYGKFRHTITSLRTTGGAQISNVALPMSLAPGESVDISVCWTIPFEGVVFDTIIIGDSCTERRLVAYEIESKADKERPDLTSIQDSCAVVINVDITEERSSDFGLRSVRILDSIQVNCTIRTIGESIQRASFVVTVTDPFNDAIYGFEAIDSADNITFFIDTIPGFTLSINGSTSPFTSYTFSPVDIGETRCDTIVIVNYGLAAKTLKAPYMRKNILFSFPPDQFEITIEPSETASLVVCYEPSLVSEVQDTDTIVLTHGCNAKEIELLGSGAPSYYSGITRCQVPLDVVVEKTNRFVVYPMPARAEVTVLLKSETSRLTVKLVDASGIEVLVRQYSGTPSKALLIDIRGVVPGIYGIVLIHDSGIDTGIIAVD
ncbi:MAG: IgGFc-binding protein [Ignavibacteria bacterium]|nr:IgGFc-binding protein [Ignavibacteria bacterium]